jgi:hypothetical protein
MAERVIAEVRDYDGFTAALRAWIVANNTTYESVNDICGFPGNYLSKMISRSPARSFSRMSLGNTLAGLGLKILLAVDAEKLAAMRPRYEPRKKHTSGGVRAEKKTPLRGNPTLAAFYAHRRALLQSPQRRRAIARKAIRIRWNRARAAEGASPGP